MLQLAAVSLRYSIIAVFGNIRFFSNPYLVAGTRRIQRDLYHHKEAMMFEGFSDGGLTVMPYLLLRVRRSSIVQDSLHVRILFPCIQYVQTGHSI